MRPLYNFVKPATIYQSWEFIRNLELRKGALE
jgi:hypothetical protein